MTRDRFTRWAPIVLGVIYVLLGIAETVRLTVTGDGGLVFWFGTLVGGGSLLLVGARPARRSSRHRTAIMLGAALGLIATAWTILIPLFAVTVIAMVAADDAGPAAPGP